jgi:phosphoribosylaminoimidazole-succinocarboxamide synthase
MSDSTGHVPFTDVDLDLPDRREGKVRISWALPRDQRLMVTTDRLSAFDRVISAVTYKGQVLNQLSAWWFDQLSGVLLDHGAGHHLVQVPDPNAMVVHAAHPLPVEVVVRGHITGVTDTSLWRRYAEGARVIDGHRLPDGLQKNTALPAAIITPTTKAHDGGHDQPLSPAQVTQRGLVDSELWDQVMATALAVFERGVKQGAAVGLILADTKYEFGLGPQGQLLLIDEVHTPDSSRWWVADSYQQRLSAGEEPESLDKEVVRRAFADLDYRGEGPVPNLPPEVWTATSDRYVHAIESLTGQPFEPGASPVAPRLISNLEEACLL